MTSYLAAPTRVVVPRIRLLIRIIILITVIEYSILVVVLLISIGLSQINGTLHLKDDWRVKETLMSGVEIGDNSGYGPPYVDRIWLGAYYNKIPIYPIFYLLKRD